MMRQFFLKKLGALILFSLFFLVQVSFADGLYQKNGFQSQLSTGYFHANMDELVYKENGSKLSELDWRTNTAIINAGVSYTFLSRLTINVNAWSNIPELNKNKMDDYDWYVPGQISPSEHSWHPDTHLSYAHSVDVNLQGWLANNHKYGLAMVVGYNYQAINLQARGGCYSYNNGADTGCSPEGEPGIDYTQFHNTPYLGFLGGMKLGKWDFNLMFKYSHWVRTSDTDYHYSRDLKFIGDGGDADFYALSGIIVYSLNENFNFLINATMNHFSESKMTTTIINTDDGTSGNGGIEGVKQTNYSASIGISYLF